MNPFPFLQLPFSSFSPWTRHPQSTARPFRCGRSTTRLLQTKKNGKIKFKIIWHYYIFHVNTFEPNDIMRTYIHWSGARCGFPLRRKKHSVTVTFQHTISKHYEHVTILMPFYTCGPNIPPRRVAGKCLPRYRCARIKHNRWWFCQDRARGKGEAGGATRYATHGHSTAHALSHTHPSTHKNIYFWKYPARKTKFHSLKAYWVFTFVRAFRHIAIIVLSAVLWYGNGKTYLASAT